MTRSEKSEYWFKQFTAYKAYEGSKSSFAELNQLPLRSFYGWCSKFEAIENTAESP